MVSMLKTVLGNLFSKGATRDYPAEKRTLPGARGELAIEVEACIFCGACARACPSRCIAVDVKACVIQSDPYACVYCGMCVEACPTACIDMHAAYAPAALRKEEVVQKGEKKTKEQIVELRKRKAPAK